jgi:hypothetical protein
MNIRSTNYKKKKILIASYSPDSHDYLVSVTKKVRLNNGCLF